MNLKTKKSVLKIYALLALAAGIALAIYRTVLLKNYYDPYNFTFEPGSGSIFRTFEYIVLFSALLMITSVFFAKKTTFQLLSERSSATSVAICAVCAFLFLTIATFSIVDLLDVFPTEKFPVSLLRVASFFSLLLVSNYFISCSAENASVKFVGKKNSRPFFSLSLPIFGLVYLAYIYFDTTLMYQDTNRIMGQVAFISILAFFVSEANIVTGHKAYSMHLATSLVCIICVSAYILPILFLVAFWEMKIVPTVLTDIASVGVLLYAIFAAFNSIKTMKETEDEI